MEPQKGYITFSEEKKTKEIRITKEK